MASIDLDYLRRIGALVRLQGREYLSHPGLLRVAHEHGLKSITNQLVSFDGESAVMRCTVEGERGQYAAYGDANPRNVGRQVASACLRMAETRAVNRALRLYTGLGMTTTEELPGDGAATVAPPPTATIADVRAALLGALPEAEQSALWDYADERLKVALVDGPTRATMVRRIRDNPARVQEGFADWMDGRDA